MKVLFIAPQPFFEERGTPIAARWAVEALAAQGHAVDLLTYHCGVDVPIKGVTHHRCYGPRGMKTVPPGFSPSKLLCDLFLCWSLLRLCRRHHYDVVHAVEESIFPALFLRPFFKNKVVYDMDSSMADQILEKWPSLEFLRRPLESFERMAFRKADLVLPVCQALADKAQASATKAPIFILHDIAIESSADASEVDDLRAVLDVKGPMLLYVGNLEHYQGIDLVLQSLVHLPAEVIFTVVVMGGTDEHIEHYRAAANRLGISDRVRFAGTRPLTHLALYLGQADILLSPRAKGTNTPLKIYSYMLAGKAILATNIYSHTQVLDDESATLCEPNPEALARGLAELVANEPLRERLGHAAHERAKAHHTSEAYRRTLAEAYAALAVQGS